MKVEYVQLYIRTYVRTYAGTTYVILFKCSHICCTVAMVIL